MIRLPTVRRAVLSLCFALALAGCKEELYTGLSEREANDIVAALMAEGIPAKKVAGGEGSTVTVEAARFGDAVSILSKQGLPAKDYIQTDQMFPEGGMVKTPTEERARLNFALSQELAQTIAEIDGVLDARVHIVLPTADMLGRDLKPSSASVFIRYAPQSNVEQYAAQIKLLVANSVEGLIYDNITVVMVPASETQTATPAGPKLADAFGIWVHPQSKSRLTALVGGLLALVVVAFAAAAWPWVSQSLRQRRGERDLAGPQPGEEGDGV